MDDTARRQSAQQTINEPPKPEVSVWTDGSVVEENGGAGIVIDYGRDHDMAAIATGKYSSSFTAEMAGIQKSFEMITTRAQRAIIKENEFEGFDNS